MRLRKSKIEATSLIKYSSEEELYKNITRDIKSIYIDLFKDLSDDEIEDIADGENTNFLEKIITLLVREYGYSNSDIEEYGVKEIKNLLSDLTIEGYDNLILE